MAETIGTTGAPDSVDARPWERQGSWHANPAYWSDEAVAQRPLARRRIRIIDATLSEGDDCVGHPLNWHSRLALAAELDASGVDEITLPSHSQYDEEVDWIREYRRRGHTTALNAKGPGITAPLRGDWRTPLGHHLDLGAEVLSPIIKWPYEDTRDDFAGALSKEAVVDAIGESIAFLVAQGARVVPWLVDSMRLRTDTAVRFSSAIVEAGGHGVYLVDSRGNSTPLATRVLVSSVRRAIGDRDLYVQHHNDLGVATANAMASVEAGADVIDATVLGVGDRGGCVALEELAPLLAMYGYETGVRLERLYDLCMATQQAFAVDLAPWKPIAGEHWNKEEGAGHLDGSEDESATCGLAPSVVGRRFESVIGAKLVFGRERSSITVDDHNHLRALLAGWGVEPDEESFRRIVRRTSAAVATSGGFITTDAFQGICEGVLDTTLG